MIDLLSVFIAFLLCMTCKDKFVDVSQVILIALAAQLAFDNLAFLDYRQANPDFIYKFKGLISCALIAYFIVNKSHFAILAIVSLDLLYNVVMIVYFDWYFIPQIAFKIYPIVTGVLLALCLLYMWTLTKIGNNLLYSRGKLNLGGVIFRCSYARIERRKLSFRESI